MIKHFFFNKNCEIDRPLSNHANIERALHEKNFAFDAINFVSQIHSNIICVIDDVIKIHGKQNLPKADAIVTNVPKLAIAVVTADCSPILLHDDKAQVIAAVHAGWRGAKADIIKNAVMEMEKLGANKANISAEIGPMIQQKSYQVSQEFFADFISDSSENEKFFQKDIKPDHYLFDLPAYVTQKLQQSGIAKINNTGLDTYPLESGFCSFRRTTHEGKQDCGRNISLIVIN